MRVREGNTAHDVLVIGGGMAGLRAAVEARRRGASVAVLSRGQPCFGVVGFNAPVEETGDSRARFFEEIMAQGRFLSQPALAVRLAYEASSQLRFLEQEGLSFRHESALYLPRLTSGSSIPRTLYTTDGTGHDIIACLRRILHDAGIEILESVDVRRVLVSPSQGRAYGVLAVDARRGDLAVYRSKAVVLATGGLGPLFSKSTNSPDLSGDGYLLALEAGAELIGMEFVQFEPFAMIQPDGQEAFTVSFLLQDDPDIYDARGQRFLPLDYRKLSKDELARKVFRQLRAGGGTPRGGILFDLTKIEPSRLKTHERFLRTCRVLGLDPAQQPVEVAPAQHYLIGGIRINERCETRVPGLFAAGETAGGVHGAGRMAGNSCTDVLVFSTRAGRYAARYARERDDGIAESPDVQVQIEKHCVETDTSPPGQSRDTAESSLRDLMWDKVGLLRSEEELSQALEAIGRMRHTLEAAGPAKTRLTLAEIICRASLLRRESRGVHFRMDFPEQNDAVWMKNIMFRSVDGQLRYGFCRPCGCETDEKWV